MQTLGKIPSFFLYAFFMLALLGNILFWSHSRTVFSEWDNVPPAPTQTTATLWGLGDSEITYRLFGYLLQNMGNTGGNFQPLKKYDYAALEKWFFVAQYLDPRADYVPFLAAYYFGAVEDEPERISHIVNYLHSEGQAAYPEKWRWLPQAIYLARHKEGNKPRALEMANQLAAMDGDLPPWARQMPAFIEMDMGNKQASYEIMMRMLVTEQDKLPPNEINAIKDYICTRTLDKAEAAQNPLCQK